ncbi:MAG TPA: phage tail protein [Aquabacterium sp.]|nr:phage tail protein [Aquabacterium sp.]
MPAAIPAVAAFAASSAVASAIVTIATSVLVNLAIGAIQKALVKKPKQFSPPVNVTVKNTIENRRIVGGTRRVGGSFVYINTSSSGGNKADLLWYVIAFTGHEVQELGDVYLDNEKVASADINDTTGVIGGSTRFVGKLKIWRRNGTSGQTVLAALDSAFPEIDSNYRLRGCAYVVLQMTRDDVAFFQGPPQAVTTICKGIKAYDPRLDTTNGGLGSHRRTDPSTWAWTENPALLTRWYLTGGSVHNTGETTRLIRYGLKEPDSRIDDALVAAAANICDETLSGANATPAGSATRYKCGFEFSTGETHRAILQELLDSMAGTLVQQHGKWRMYAGAFDAPLHSFDEEDLTGELEVSDTTEGTDRYNAVSAIYFDAAQGYAEATTQFRTDSAYETQDGGQRITREIDLRAVTDVYQAQRLAEIELRKSRMMRTIRLVGGLNLLKVGLNETFTFSHERYGWVNRVFRCRERQVEVDQDAGRVTITARQESSAVYADLLTADYVTGTSATDQFKVEIPDAPTSLTTTNQVQSIRVNVGLPASLPLGAVVQVFRHSASTPFSSAVLVAQARTDVFVFQHRDAVARFYWARIKTRSGALSDTFPASVGVMGTPLLVQTPDISALAVSETIEYTDDFAQSQPLPIGGGGPLLYRDSLASIGFGAQTYDYFAVVTFMADMWKLEFGGPAEGVAYIESQFGGISTGQLQPILETADPGGRVVVQHTVFVPAGQSCAFVLVVEKTTLAGLEDFVIESRNLSMRLEVKKK